MSLKLNSSGGGSVTLQEPVTASTLTLNLPAFSGTVANLAAVTNNGVLYVNSSGQPTSGSALTFDGTNLYMGATIGAKLALYQSGGSNIYGFGIESGALTFLASSSERMRLDSSGNLLVGLTVAQGQVLGAQIRAAGDIWSGMSASTNATSTLNVYSTGAAAYRFYVGMAGTVYATSTTITAISDQRLKENIRDLDDGLDVVMALKPRKFDWKEGRGENIKNARGFIAQEFEQVLPDMIHEWRDAAPEGEDPYKAVNANLIPTLVKAIQEQQAIIKSLKARLDAANL